MKETTLFYREAGSGPALLFLHGGWGYEAYPFDAQIVEFGRRMRILIPDRPGYGKSGRTGKFPIDFHHGAALRMVQFLDEIDCADAVLWGHSDGAVIAAWMAIENPQRFPGIILEALHYYRNKPASRSFFETGARNPDAFGSRLVGILSREHGEQYWRELMRHASDVWLRLADEAPHPKADLFNGRLPELSVPTLLIHGGQDPRNEPDELQRVRQDVPHAFIQVIETAGHSPHSESPSVSLCNKHAADFLRTLGYPF